MANQIEYICSYCGTKKILNKASGRPMPGNCPRKPRGPDGKMRPHTWIVTVGCDYWLKYDKRGLLRWH